MKALECLPEKIPVSLEPTVTALLQNTHFGVQTFAFEAARRLNNPEHGPIAVTVLKQARDEWLQRAASDTAIRYGLNYECAKAWADHIVPPANVNDYLPHNALSHLSGILSEGNAFPTVPKEAEQARRMRESLNRFLDAHKAEIQAGKKFKPEEFPAESR
jgi:hypothetical protein